MPGTNAGTGYPLTLRCTICKRGRNWRSYAKSDVEQGTHLVRTGAWRTFHNGKGNPRALHEQHEYRCLDCGHIGWTRMSDILQMPVESDRTP